MTSHVTGHFGCAEMPSGVMYACKYPIIRKPSLGRPLPGKTRERATIEKLFRDFRDAPTLERKLAAEAALIAYAERRSPAGRAG